MGIFPDDYYFITVSTNKRTSINSTCIIQYNACETIQLINKLESYLLILNVN